MPGLEISCCHFHLSQNLPKQIKSIGLVCSYNSDPDFALHPKTVTARYIVPKDDIDSYMDALATALPEECVQLLNWFEDSYIGHPIRRGTGTKQTLFPAEMWNMHRHRRILQDSHNNHPEAANRRLRSELGMLHPSIWNFLHTLKRVQKERDDYFGKLLAWTSNQITNIHI